MSRLELPLHIAGLGRYLPQRIVTNAELEAECGLASGWIETRNGVKKRHWVFEESNAYMGARAAEEALAQANLKLADIDLILNASGTNEVTIPDTSVYLQRELGEAASSIACWSLHATCLSFLVALDTAASLLASGRYGCILVVSAELGSTSLNKEHPESYTLFGDGAAAAVVRRPTSGETGRLERAQFETYSEGADLTTVAGGGTRHHPNDPATRFSDNTFQMAGRQVLKLSRRRSGGFLERLRTGLSSSLPDIDLVVPHQASLVGLRLLESFGWPAEQIVKTLPDYGNCIAASLPLSLHEAVSLSRLRRGDTFLMVGTGAGLSLGGLVLRY